MGNAKKMIFVSTCLALATLPFSPVWAQPGSNQGGSDALRDPENVGQQPTDIVRVYYLKNTTVDQSQRIALNILANEPGIRISLDMRSNSMILSGSERQHAKFKKLLELIDVARPVKSDDLFPKNLTIHLTWLVDGAPKSDDESSGPDAENKSLPFDYSSLDKPAPRTLKLFNEQLKQRISFTDPRVAAQLMVKSTTTVRSGQRAGHFDTVGSGRLGALLPYKLVFNGAVSQTADDSVRLDVKIDTTLGQDTSLVETSIHAPLNHPVCLGIAPLGKLESLLVIEVVAGE